MSLHPAAPAPLLPVVIDSREQLPYAFSEWCTLTVACLQAGDYSVSGMEGRIAIERKSLSDYMNSITTARDRFLRELERLQGYDFAAVVVEATLAEVTAHAYRSMAAPASVLGTTWAITVRRLPVFFAGDREHAEIMTEGLLSRFWRDEQKRRETASATPTPEIAPAPSPAPAIAPAPAREAAP